MKTKISFPTEVVVELNVNTDLLAEAIRVIQLQLEEMLIQGIMSNSPIPSILKPSRILEIQVLQQVAARHGGLIPVKLRFAESAVMQGVSITAEVPGQIRTVMVTGSQLRAIGSQQVQEAIVDEVCFAIFLLLDKDEDDD